VPFSGTFTYPGDIVTLWAHKQPATIVALNSVAIQFANLIIYTSSVGFGSTALGAWRRQAPLSRNSAALMRATRGLRDSFD
jgi:hypothetical protein